MLAMWGSGGARPRFLGVLMRFSGGRAALQHCPVVDCSRALFWAGVSVKICWGVFPPGWLGRALMVKAAVACDHSSGLVAVKCWMFLAAIFGNLLIVGASTGVGFGLHSTAYLDAPEVNLLLFCFTINLMHRGKKTFLDSMGFWYFEVGF